jgi:hypothetical protein
MYIRCTAEGHMNEVCAHVATYGHALLWHLCFLITLLAVDVYCCAPVFKMSTGLCM